MKEKIVPQPIKDNAWPEAAIELRDDFAGRLNVYRVMAHHPKLLMAWAPLRQHVVLNTALGGARSEVVILRTAFRFGSDYEWAHHVSRARAAGFSDERIAALKGVPQPQDKLIVEAVDALIDDRRLLRESILALEDTIGREGVFDLIATVGFYSTLAYLVMSFGTPIDDDVADELSKHPFAMSV